MLVPGEFWGWAGSGIACSFFKDALTLGKLCSVIFGTIFLFEIDPKQLKQVKALKNYLKRYTKVLLTIDPKTIKQLLKKQLCLIPAIG